MKRIGILTSGGDAPGMNACIRAAVRTALANDLAVAGIRRGGYTGLIAADAVSLDRAAIRNTIHLGGTILETSRNPDFYTREGRLRAAAAIERMGGLDGVVLIGGGGGDVSRRKPACRRRGYCSARGGGAGEHRQRRLRDRLLCRVRHGGELRGRGDRPHPRHGPVPRAPLLPRGDGGADGGGVPGTRERYRRRRRGAGHPGRRGLDRPDQRAHTGGGVHHREEERNRGGGGGEDAGYLL